MLKGEAKERGLSTNQCVASVLKKYTEWDRFAEKLGYAGSSSFIYKLVVSMIPDDKLEQFGTDSVKLVRDELLLFYKKVNLEAFLRWMSLLTKYAWGNSLHYDQKSEQDNYILTIHHTFAKRWSHGFTSHMREAVKEIAGVEPKIVATDNTLTITIPKDAKLAFK